MQEIKLIDLMPSSISNDDTVKAICEVLDPYIKKMWDEVDYISIYKNIDKYPDEILDSLAWHFHVDFYKDTMPIETKRIMVKNSIKYHRKKGTPWAVEDMLSNLFRESRLTEWFEYGGDPYYFQIRTTDNLSDEKYHDLISALWVVKNTRSWLEKIVLERYININYAMYAVVNRKRRIYQRFDTKIEKKKELYYGMARVFIEKKITFKMPAVYFIREDGVNVNPAFFISGDEIMWGER